MKYRLNLIFARLVSATLKIDVFSQELVLTHSESSRKLKLARLLESTPKATHADIFSKFLIFCDSWNENLKLGCALSQKHLNFPTKASSNLKSPKPIVSTQKYYKVHYKEHHQNNIKSWFLRANWLFPKWYQ